MLKENNLKEIFITKANIKHNNLYNYSLADYKNNKTKIIIICNIHGEFTQRPDHHIRGGGCPQCNYLKLSEKFSCKLSEDQIQYIDKNINILSIKKKSKNIGISSNTLNKYIKKYNLTKRLYHSGPKYKSIPAYYWYNLRKNAQTRKLIFDISPEDVWCILEKQKFKCALSGLPIDFKLQRTKSTASVDRIDSSIGYIKSNIQIVHKKINKMKNNLSDKDFIFLCQMVTKNNEVNYGNI